MKLLCAEYNSQGRMAVCVVGDNALLRNNNDFYYPAFTRELSCVPQLVLRACKLGKGVSGHFAGRYYDAVALGVRFYADTLEQELKAENLPAGLAASFDDSAALSEMLPYAGENIAYSMKINGEVVFSGTMNDLPVKAGAFVAEASGYYMIKIGDFFFCGNPFRYKGIKIGDRLQLYINDDKCLLDFHIR